MAKGTTTGAPAGPQDDSGPGPESPLAASTTPDTPDPDSPPETQAPAAAPDLADPGTDSSPPEPPSPAPPGDAAPAPAAPPARSRGGFLPTMLGGIIAAALGFAAAWFLLAQQGDDGAFDSRLAAQEQALAALGERIDSLPPAPDLAPLAADTAALEERADSLRDTLDGLTTRVDALEQTPAATSPATTTDAPATAPALAALNTRLAALEAELDHRTDMLRAEIAASRAETEAEALSTLRGAALLRLQAALDSGAPFADTLAAATDNPPPALAALAETGVPTLAALRESFPAAARAALAAARDAGLAQDGAGVTGWLRQVLNVRSTRPRAGDDADAVLSRAEAALNRGDLAAALDLLDALPESVQAADDHTTDGQTPLADWRAQARARQDALAAAATLGTADN